MSIPVAIALVDIHIRMQLDPLQFEHHPSLASRFAASVSVSTGSARL